MSSMTSHRRSSSSFNHHLQSHQQDQEEDESDLSSLDGEGDFEMEEDIHTTTTRNKLHLYNNSLNTSSSSIHLPLPLHHDHPPSSSSSSIMKHRHKSDQARDYRSISPEIPLDQLAIHNGSRALLPPALQLQLPTTASSHVLQPQPDSGMDMSSPPDLPTRSSIKRRRGHSVDPPTPFTSNMTPLNSTDASISFSSSISNRKVSNLNRFNRLYSAQPPQSHSPPSRNKKVKTATFANESHIDPPPSASASASAFSSTSNSKPAALKLPKSTPHNTEAKDSLNPLKGKQKVGRDQQMEVADDDNDAVSLGFAIREERNAAVVARERIASSKMGKGVVDHWEEEDYVQKKTKESPYSNTGGRSSMKTSVLSSSSSSSTSSSCPTSSKTILSNIGNSKNEIPEELNTMSEIKQKASGDKDSAGEAHSDAVTATHHHQKGSRKRYMRHRFNGKNFGENLSDYIDAHPDSTTIKWSSPNKEYLLIYGLDKLRRELNNAGITQQSAVNSLVKQLTNYHYTLVTDTAIKERFLAGTDVNQKYLLHVYKHEPPSAAQKTEDEYDDAPSTAREDRKSAPPEHDTFAQSTSAATPVPESESDLSDIVADDEAEQSGNPIVDVVKRQDKSARRQIKALKGSAKRELVQTESQVMELENEQVVNTPPDIVKRRGRKASFKPNASAGKIKEEPPSNVSNVMIEDRDIASRTRHGLRTLKAAGQMETPVEAQELSPKRPHNLKRKVTEQDQDDTTTNVEQPVLTARKRIRVSNLSPQSPSKSASLSPHRRKMEASFALRRNKTMSLSPRKSAPEETSQSPHFKKIRTRAQSCNFEVEVNSPRSPRRKSIVTSKNTVRGVNVNDHTRAERKLSRSASSSIKSVPDDPLTDPRFLRALARRWSPIPESHDDVKDEIEELEQVDQETEDDVAAMKKYEDVADADADIDEEMDEEKVGGSYGSAASDMSMDCIQTVEDVKVEDAEEPKIEPASDLGSSASTQEHLQDQSNDDEDSAQSKEDAHEAAILARSLQIRSTSPQPVAAQLAMRRALKGLTKPRQFGEARVIPRKQRVSVSLPCGSSVAHISSILAGNTAKTAPFAKPSVHLDDECTSKHKQGDECLDASDSSSKLQQHPRSMSLSTVATSTYPDERQLQEDQIAEDQSGFSPRLTSQISFMVAQAIPSVEIEPASCKGTPELEVDDDEDPACHGDTSADSGYHASSKFFPEYLHPMSSPALCPVPDIPTIKNDPSDEEDLAELLFRINMPSPRAMLAGLPTGRTPEVYRNRLETNNSGKSSLSRLDSNESVLWSRANALQAELPNLKFAGSSIPVFSDNPVLPSQSTLNDDLGIVTYPAGYYNAQPFEVNPPVPAIWKAYEIFSPDKSQFDHQLRMQNVKTWTLSAAAAEYGDRRSPERMLEGSPSQCGSEGSRGKSISPFDTVIKY